MTVRRNSPELGIWQKIRAILMAMRPGPRATAELSSMEEDKNITSAASEQIYCLKCKERTDTLEAREVVLKNGRAAVTGHCAVCGTKKFRMGGARK